MMCSSKMCSSLCSSKLKTFAASFLALLLIHSVAMHIDVQAQVAGGAITGTVVDSSGRVIPNANVSITNLATGINRTVTTNEDGLYIAPNLLPATYELTFAAPGFRTDVRSGIELTVGATVTLNTTMQVGGSKETVQVQTEASDVQLATSDISAVVNATTVRELPLNGRSWTDLATLQPGVNRIQTQPDFAAGTDRGNRGFGQQLTISGARPQQNNYRLDGISLNDYANGAPGSVLGGSLGVDAIQEFSVLTSNYSAEYGKTSGGVVNAISRSGTNQLHGSIYEFLRNSALDAPGYFDKGTVPPFRQNQFGASAGGPIRKDHTFVFGDYEGVRRSLGTTVTNTTLSDNARLGIIHDTDGNLLPPFVGTCPANSTLLEPSAGVCVDNKVAKYLPMFRPANAGTTGTGDKAFCQYVSQQVVSENYFTTRVDQKFSEKDSLFGTYVYDYSPLTQPDPLNNLLLQATAKRQIAAIEENHTFTPTFLNSFRIGYNRDAANAAQTVKVLNPVAADSTLAWAPEPIPVGPPRAQGPVTSAPGMAPPTFTYAWNAYQLYDDAFWTKGLHSLKFGFGYERDQLNETTNTADFPGTFKFGSIQALLTNKPKSVQGVVPGQTTPRYMRLSIIGGYVPDDWRLRP